MIKNIIFDFGKVLVDYDFSRFFAILRAENPCHKHFEDFMRLILDKQTCVELDKGELPFADYVASYKARYPQCADLIEAFDTRFQEIVLGEVPGMQQLFACLKEQGLRILGLSNWSTKVYDTMPRFEVFKYIEDRVLSCEEHMLKPDREIYERALQRFGIKAEESIFVDDKAENVEGAKSVGIDGILFINPEQFCEELAKRGIEVKAK